MPIPVTIVVAIAVTIAAAELASTVEQHGHVVETAAAVDFLHFTYKATLHKPGTDHKQGDVRHMGYDRGVGYYINRRTVYEDIGVAASELLHKTVEALALKQLGRIGRQGAYRDDIETFLPLI